MSTNIDDLQLLTPTDDGLDVVQRVCQDGSCTCSRTRACGTTFS